VPKARTLAELARRYDVSKERAMSRLLHDLNYIIRPMLFKFQIFKMDEVSGAVVPFLPPFTFNLPSADVARAMIKKVVDHRDVPAHSVTINSEDGSISERWFWLDGVWRQKNA
jgi:hypothetical protein